MTERSDDYIRIVDVELGERFRFARDMWERISDAEMVSATNGRRAPFLPSWRVQLPPQRELF